MTKRTFLVALMLCSFVFSATAFPISVLAASNTEPFIPTFLVKEGWKIEESQPLLRGVTQNDTRVAVYIDGVFHGHAQTKNHPSGTASFAYTPFLHLSAGIHTIQARAENRHRDGSSQLSEPRHIEVVAPYPAPTLFQPKVVDKRKSQKPLITGLARKDSVIKVFIDGKLNGTFKVKNTNEAVTDFSYEPFLNLDPNAGHVMYATAVDGSGKESPFSNVIGFQVRKNTAVRKPVSKIAAGPYTEKDGTTNQSKVSGEETTAIPEVPPTREEKRTEDTVQPTPTPTETDEINGEATPEAAEDEDTNAAVETEADEIDDNGAVGTASDDKEKEDAAKKDENSGNRSWAVWIIVIIIILIILFRSRDRFTGGSQAGSDTNPDTRKALGKIIDTEAKGASSDLPSGEKKDQGGGNMPPPPPPASGY